MVQFGAQLDVLAVLSLVELFGLPKSSAEGVVRGVKGELLSCFHISKIIMGSLKEIGPFVKITI